jgi:hypothetical protein
MVKAIREDYVVLFDFLSLAIDRKAIEIQNDICYDVLRFSEVEMDCHRC